MHYENAINGRKNNPKELWKFLNSVLPNKRANSPYPSKLITKFQELFNIHNPNKLSQHHRNILVVNVTYACPTLFSLPNPY